ncbi:superoxide dismutase [Fimbriimonas ginsengisoli]|uniref:superoxide dismutase n=1 Tax=Fimbriimonas ginsengisoli Gsoil 348 TaxID=661478 RepID=A0A068NY95_FIMGI|nr:Fe-Mn family superoxide dismutase [Fimbriimonas ginsengisoli]AIE87945.1 Superoxide dismutase [Fimbriimonas ginsengisoli Gsoil 348]
MIASAAAGVTAVAGAPLNALARTKEIRKNMEPKLVHVPTEADIQKALKTAPKGISEATHKAHLTLWQGYANKTNEIRKALAEMEVDPAKANQIYSQMRALKVNYAFALGGYKNHNVYFDTIGGDGGAPSGDVATLINEAYGSYENWAKDIKTTGIAGRGWAYLAYDRDEQRVFNFIGDAQDTFPQWNCELILALDVYEHAYFLDFQTARAKYIDAWLNCVDWNAVNARLGKAK